MPASKPLKQVSQKVFKRVEKAASPLRPTQLLDDLSRKYSYADVQDALSDLLEDQRISLTPDRHLIISSKA
ncbi:hypothetical protein [Tunturiibacter gelidoferens]|uniref:Uncharacterized protein n=1 Tax=Tunturiibacter lichenicola TaxID=2051959 RepID=A0A7Y9NPI1_9BACT|nr:hypothetical protein [Edaphobacter lichenicola]NYF53176.1 hypothetical protein [Edaphobacter lichenicola]